MPAVVIFWREDKMSEAEAAHVDEAPVAHEEKAVEVVEVKGLYEQPLVVEGKRDRCVLWMDCFFSLEILLRKSVDRIQQDVPVFKVFEVVQVCLFFRDSQ